MTAMTVHTMGVPSWWDIPDELRSQIRLAHDLRNALVELQHGYEETVRAIWSSFPAVADCEAALAAAESEAAAAAQALSAEKSRQRTKRVTGPIADRLRTARATVKSARQIRRDTIAAVREQALPRLKSASEQLRADQKRLYKQYCTDGDLYWATFNAVLEHHKTAVKMLNQKRAQGRPAQLRFHRWDGTGTIAVQLQRAADAPPRTPATIADPTGRWANVLMLPWHDPDGPWSTMTRAEQRRAGRIEARIRCGSSAGSPVWITVPLQAHRFLPADADITWAQLTLTRTAGHIKARLAITAKVADPQPVPHNKATVAVHLGWRRTDTGTRVATWRADTPLTIPEHLRAVVTADRDRLAGTIVLPDSIIVRLDRHAETASVRALSLDSVRSKVADWLSEHGPVPYRGSQIGAADVMRWRSPARFAALAAEWRTAPPSDGAAIAGVLEMWRSADRKLWESSEHGRSRALGHRNDIYRQIAAAIVAQAAAVVVDDTNIAAISYAAVERSDLPNDTQTAIDRRRTHAAPGMLREALSAAATRDAVPVHTVNAAGLTRIHARCGHENPADDRYLTRPVPCDGCGATYDPDSSATWLMLQRASSQSTT